MTKREFLESKGYCFDLHRLFVKYIGSCECRISIFNKKFYIYREGPFVSQEDIDKLQKAFNEVKKDLKKCMKLEG